MGLRSYLPEWAKAPLRKAKVRLKELLLLDIIPTNKPISLRKRTLFILFRLFTGHLLTRGTNANAVVVVPVKFGTVKRLGMLKYNPFLSTARKLGHWETELVEVMSHWIPKCNTLIDVGSHDGFYAIIFAKLCTDSRIIVLEPNESVNSLISKNLSTNGIDLGERVKILNSFLGMPDKFPNCDSHKVVTLDTLVADLQEPILIKIDIDGGELNALESGKDMLRQKRCVIIVETHSFELENQCVSLMSELGYRCNIIKNAWWRFILPEERPIGHNRWFVAENCEESCSK